jgi:D-3-phosphoglycerate dehydrogenase
MSPTNLGRKAQGGEAICLVSIDEPTPASVLHALSKIPQVKQARALEF